MFSGIIDHTGIIKKIKRLDSGISLSIETNFLDLKLGQSISVDGVCLTVTEYKNGVFSCDLSPETLKLTIANFYEIGRKVNLEKPLKMSEEIGGHLVLGHVDYTLNVLNKSKCGEFYSFIFGSVSEEYMSLLVKKGSVAINGISLTVNEVLDQSFEVMIIPHTLNVTNFSELEIGSKVNVEFDFMTKLIVKEVRKLFELMKDEKCFQK